MPRLLLTAGVVFALVGSAGQALAQNTDVMPGAVVGSTGGDKFKLVGREEPRVGRPVGNPINLPTASGLMRPYNPANPYEAFQGTNLSAKSVVAPANGYPSNVPTSAFDQFINTIKTIAGIDTKPMVQRVYTPGIYRRDHQRVQERMFVRD